MKYLKYICLFAAAFLSFQGMAQDVALTNAKLDGPAPGEQYGSACFTIIVEDGLQVSSIPVAVEITLSKVSFDLGGIHGFNSDKFDWTQDAFASNVVKGTLVSDIPDVDNGGGGAQICVPVTAADLSDERNGFLVNVVPGSIDQGGNSGVDNISRFVFSNNGSSSDLIVHKQDADVVIEWRDETVMHVESYEIQRSFDGINFEVIETISQEGGLGQRNVDIEYVDKDVEAVKSKSIFYRVNSNIKSGESIHSETRTVNFNKALNIFPNPARNLVNINFEKIPAGYSLSVYNTQNMKVKEVSNLQQGNQIDVSDYTPGMYLVELRNKEGIITARGKIAVIR